MLLFILISDKIYGRHNNKSLALHKYYKWQKNHIILIYYRAYIKINAETSDLNPSVMCTSRSGNRHSLCFSFLLCSKYCSSYTTKLERVKKIFSKLFFAYEGTSPGVKSLFARNHCHSVGTSEQ